MESRPTFEFIDEPQFRTEDSREHAAHLLRSYRKQSRFTITKRSPHEYLVRLNFPGSPVGLIVTRQ